LLTARGYQVLELDIRFSQGGEKLSVMGVNTVREWFYELALISFSGAAIDMFLHLLVAQVGRDFSSNFWSGLFVLIAANGVPSLQVCTSWWALRWGPEKSNPRDFCSYDFWQCAAYPDWALVEILTGVAYLFLFGAGYYLGPACIMLAGIVRFTTEYSGRNGTMVPASYGRLRGAGGGAGGGGGAPIAAASAPVAPQLPRMFM